ncbi:MAG: metallophosphoesterase [Chlorobiaceae bacterium]|nr:metallophosphoesterase [Chlorobiaceae bacterium]
MPGYGDIPIVRFGVVTDIHYDSKSNPGEAAKLREWIENSRKYGVDFLLQLGDIIRGSDEESEEELRQVLDIIQEFPGTIRHVIGNHCLAQPGDKLLFALGMSKPFYSFSAKGFRFIVLHGMDISVLNTPDCIEDQRTLEFFQSRLEIDPWLHDYCGAIGSRQIVWLKSELAAAEMAGEQAIAICHFPLFQKTTDEKHGLLWNHSEIAELLAASPAMKACISGHYHYGGYLQEHGKHFIVLPAFVNRQAHPEFSFGTVELKRERMVIRNQEGITRYDLSII